MDHYFFDKSEENSDSFDSCDRIYQSFGFMDNNFDSIPSHDDHSFSQAFDTDEIHLPPPPGTFDDSPLQSSSNYRKDNTPSPDSSASHPRNVTEDDLPMTLNTANIPIPGSYSCQIENISLPPPPPPPPPSAPPSPPQLPLPTTPPEEKEWNIDQEMDGAFTENEKIIESPEVSDQKMMEDCKYSPSKLESDEEGQESAIVKPKVLGKEAAKKRLMAFSLSKQPSKKQNKVTPVKTGKNLSKSSNVQDVFRTTISEIEAEKRKMFQNMPSHLISELSELSKPSSVIPPSNVETQKTENTEPNVKDTLIKDEASSSNLNETPSKVEEPVKKNKSPSRNNRSQSKSKRSRSRSNRRSQSRGKRRRRSRSRRRSSSKSITNQSRNRKRSSSRSRRRRRSGSRSRRRSNSRNRRRSDSQNRSFNEGKTKGDYYTAYSGDWKSFKAAGHVVQVESEDPRLNSKEGKRMRQPPTDWSSTITRPRNYFRPTFNLLKRKAKPIASLRVTPADPDNKIQMLYSEKTIRYTKARPIIHWAENPSQTTDYYMAKDLLLDNSDDSAVRILNSIIESGKKTPAKSFDEPLPLKSRPWYPRQNYFSPQYGDSKSEELDFSKNSSEGIDKSLNLTTSKKEIKPTENPDNKEKEEPDSEGEIKSEEENDSGKNKEDRSFSASDSVCNKLSSDEDPNKKGKETAEENIKIEVDVGSHSVKVRSRWDSDFDGEASGKEAANNCKEESMEISTSDDEEKMDFPLVKENLDVKNARSNKIDVFPEKTVEDSRNLNKSNTYGPTLPGVSSNSPSGNLVSEYEEFLKMVSFDSCGGQEGQSEEKHLERPSVDVSLDESKSTKVDKPTGVEKGFRVETTDWDQESDHEQKSNVKKTEFDKSETHHKVTSMADDNLDSKKKKNKKGVVVKKKSGKVKLKKKKLSKKSSKAKKKNYRDSSSSDTSSESSESDSDSDSDDSHSPKRKKKKITKEKKKFKKDSSSESESDESYDGKMKKKKTKKKKKKGKKRKSSTSDSDEVHNALMKQLDLNKQLIMKKIEEIDYISERSGKKGKENQQKKKDKQNLEESEILDKYIKTGKKKKSETKIEKDKKVKSGSKKSEFQGKGKKGKFKKGRSSSESESEDSEGSVKKKRTKKDRKRRRSSSESSTSEEKTYKASKVQSKLEKVPDVKSFKTKEKKDKLKKVKKLKKKKKREYSSSDSDSVRDFEKPAKKDKKGRKSEENSSKDWKDSFTLNEMTYKASENRSDWEGKESDWKSSGNKTSEGGRKGDDWEESSSVEESPEKVEKRESSWDEEDSSVKTKKDVNKELLDDKETVRKGEKNNLEQDEKGDVGEKSLSGPFEGTDQQASDSLKTSMSNFSFNENSFCAFGQELSRDFFLMEPNFSNSAQLPPEKTKEAIVIEPRPFHSVSQSSDAKKSGGSELYSPGYSESEASDAETGTKTGRVVDNSKTRNESREEVYDPLNCESEGSAGNDDVELGSIPLPRVSDILLPGEPKNVSKDPVSIPLPEKRPQGRFEEKIQESDIKPSDVPSATDSPSKFGFIPVSISDYNSACILKEKLNTTSKKGVISMKGQRKLKSKAAAVFQDESDDEFEVADKGKPTQSEVDNLKGKIVDSMDVTKNRGIDNKDKLDLIGKEEVKEKKTGKELNRARSMERERRSGEKKDYPFVTGKDPSPRKNNMTPNLKLICPNKEKLEIKSDSFEIEPLNSYTDSTDVEETVQRIPVVTGLGGPSGGSWSRSHLTAYGEYPEVSASVMNNASFDLYTVQNSKFPNQSYDKDFMADDTSSTGNEKSSHKSERSKKEKRKSRSRSLSPKKRRKSKSPRGRSPRKRSSSPKRRDRSPYSPRRRSPKRKSYRSSRSPDRRRKSRSRSPRKRRNDSGRRSRSLSPRKHRSPKRRGDSPRRESFSPRRSISPRKDSRFNLHYSDSVQKRIPVIGSGGDDVYMEISPKTMSSPRLESQRDYPGYMNDSSRTVSEINDPFYNRDYADEFGIPSYSEDVSMNNLITVKNHDIAKPTSPERLSLDQRIELELAGQSQSEQYPMQNQFPEMNSTHFPSSYNSENTNSGESFYPNSEVSSQYFNGRQQQSNYGQFPSYTNSQGVKSSVLQVGNIVEVVPTLQHPPPPLPSKPHQILQVGNVLQVVPSPKIVPPPQAVPPPEPQNYGSPSPMAPVVKTQKATAVVAPSSIVPTPNPEAVINPLIKAIQLEREKRRKEKEKRKAEREARRKARQLRREAKLMSVNEKLKKSVQDEGLMLGQEVEDDELLDGSDIPSPPIPVEIITVSSQSTLPPAGKGILITAGFMPKPPSEKKEVKFADGVCPGEGTSTSGGEDITSPPPKPKLPKEKRYKKKKMKVKKKVKVQIIRQIIQDEDDDEDDDLSPPPPPPGDPPPVFFARFPFVGDAQFPIYQTQTTTTTLTTVQYPAPSFQ